MINEIVLTDESLLHYKRCRRRTYLNFYGEHKQKSKEKDFCQKLKQSRISLAWQTLQRYNLPFQQPRLIAEKDSDLDRLAAITEELMSKGVECIYQGVIKTEFNDGQKNKITLISSPTLLVKENRSSAWGNWSYFSVNTHLGKNLKQEYKLISGLHAHILRQMQDTIPHRSEMVLRSRAKVYQTRLAIWMPRARQLVDQCVQMLITADEPEVFISRQRCSLCPWYDSCYQIAKSSAHLSLIPGVTPRRYEALVEQGISDLPTLASTSLSNLQALFPQDIATKIQQQAQSLYSGQPNLKQQTLAAVPHHQIEFYFDIETDPDRNLHYLLGVLLVDYEQKKEQYFSFLAKEASEEKTVWQDFLNLTCQYPHAPIFHYSIYEVETIIYLANLYGTQSEELQTLLARCFDLHKFVTSSWYLPIENYSLKSVANWLGFYWRNPQTDSSKLPGTQIAGDQCVFWYDQWSKTSELMWLDYILIYNYDDCWATYELKKWLDSQSK